MQAVKNEAVSDKNTSEFEENNLKSGEIVDK